MTATALPPRNRWAVFAGDIKIHHTVFALPWAILSAAVAGRAFPGRLGAGCIALIIVCMVTARTVAMAANRLIDARLDAVNPRTAGRAIPSGAISRGFVVWIMMLCCAGFIAACAGFLIFYHNAWPLALCLPVLGFLAAYPFLKRFTRLCHYYLGAALALAPVCAWVAVAGRIDWPPVVMFGVVLCWTAGFDIIYACQDYASDVATGVYSVPAKIGIARALWISRATHLVCLALLVVLGRVVPWFGAFYYCGVAIAAILLVVEQSLVRPNDLSRVNLAFFTINGVISLMMATLGILDLVR